MSIFINDVSKKFDKDTNVLKNINLKIERGVFGVIGYNSSGKSTLIKIITSLIEPTSGNVQIFGCDVKKESKKKICKNIGYLPQKFSFYENYSILEFMNCMAKMHGMKRSTRQERINEVLIELSLYDKRQLKFYQLTDGMKRRVGLAQAMLNKPHILVVDDPVLNVDKDEKIKIKEILNQYGKNNIVIISTRVASDLEGIVSNLAVIHKGEVCYNGTSDELIKRASGNVWISNIGGFMDVNRLKGIHKVVSFDKIGPDYYARVISDVKPYKDSEIVKATLEDAFLYSVYSS